MVLEGQARKVQDGIGQELIGGHKGMYGQRGMKDTDKWRMEKNNEVEGKEQKCCIRGIVQVQCETEEIL